ncbi:hydrophobin 1 [Moniliophthora roreri]|uniref:Hydrophobin n=1 Tax=Moniliophthora roreri TaxID=221103 RepID=A0A0W0EXC7_MONRR|nr:hydrophobin 1 [Moniliophthora roreri]
MQHKVAVVGSLATLAAATILPASQCLPPDRQLQYCDFAQTASESPALEIIGLLAIPINDPNVLVGLRCTPFSVWGSTCNPIPLCCKDNDYLGIIAVDCVPVDVNL